MKEILITDPAEMIREFNSLPNHYIFRGQANADWHLTSSLERVVGSAWCASAARKYEELSLARFQGRFHLYDRENIEPDSKLAWLAIMQHYGVPTRILDFTESPFVALYFALETYRASSGKDLAVYAIDWTAAMKKSVEFIQGADATFKYTLADIYDNQDHIFDNYINPRAYDIIWITEPRKHNQRLDKQAGSFVISGNRDRKIEDILASPLYNGVDVTKFVLNHDLHAHIFALLMKVNLTGKVLYGDLHGLATSIRMEMDARSSAAWV